MTVEQDLLNDAIAPAACLLPAGWDSPTARVIVLTIFGQEADFRHRWQVIDPKRPELRGPAKGLGQMERGGGAMVGIFDVKRFPKLAPVMIKLCAALNVGPTLDERFQALEKSDVLAAGLARGLLYSDPFPLPALGDEEAAWQLYLRTWRPGAFTRGDAQERLKLRRKWAGYYARALAAVTGK